MNCFYHFENSAVGVCKNCNRGLCLNCVAEVDNGIACSNRCEAAVATINDVMEKSSTISHKTASAYIGIAWAMILLGSPLFLMGVSSVIVGKASAGAVNLIMSLSLYLGAFVLLRAAKRLRS